ncbi:MAG TPA: GatB/YqeY domain-containing protein [Candidatus Paceibacterota bacterium]|nr:GatB/YqeY domain-containing protein [Candidatus Paceibacterota bacterium]
MALQQQIKDQIKEAMLAKEAVRLSVLRGLSSAFTNELVATKRKPDVELPDEEAISVIRRQVKQRKDSIEQFRKGGREDLAAAEEAEMKILEVYLPQMMSREEILKVAEAKKAELGITDKSKMGAFMGAVMKELKGRADGAAVKEVVESLF